jgi:hypothetical protein
VPSKDRTEKHHGGRAKPPSRLRAVQEGLETADEDGVRPWVKRDPSDCPEGADPAVWDLALKFQQAAARDRIELAAGLPVIYMELNRIIDRYGIRDRTWHHDMFGCKHREDHPGLASRCWYHWPPYDPGKQEACVITWTQMIEVIFAEFWSRIHDAHALDQLRQSFAEYGEAALAHWFSCRVSRDISEQPPKPRVRRVRQERPAGTMADASKEG